MKTFPASVDSIASFLMGARLPLPARRHPGMITPEERCALYGLTLNYFEASGSIVDAGCFLGASTACFGSALRKRGFRDSPVVRAYDLAIVGNDSMARLVRKAGGREDIGHDDSFADILRSAIAPYSDLVDLRIGDIRETLDGSDPIEILFVDCCKGPSIGAAVVKSAFPRLIPGRSIVVQQDFYHEWLPWLHVAMGRLSAHFSYIGAAASSAFFLCTSAISEDEAAFDAWSELGPEDALAAFERALPDDIEADQRYFADLAKSILLRRGFGVERALAFLRGVSAPEASEITSNWTLPGKAGVEGWLSGPLFGRWP